MLAGHPPHSPSLALHSNLNPNGPLYPMPNPPNQQCLQHITHHSRSNLHYEIVFNSCNPSMNHTLQGQHKKMIGVYDQYRWENALMTSTIFSLELGHVGPVTPNKIVRSYRTIFHSLWRVSHKVLGPRFGLPLHPSSFLTIFGHTYVTTFSHV